VDIIPEGLMTRPLPAAVLHKLTAAIRTGSVRISVVDSGEGLTPTQLANIAAEGVQFNANELLALQGGGLGLFISKGLVEQQGGTLSLASEGVGKGVTYQVELPLFRKLHANQLADNSDLPSRRSGSLNLDNNSNESSYRSVSNTVGIGGSGSSSTHLPGQAQARNLLIVDDSLLNRKMLLRLMTLHGYSCEQAEDGAQALEKYSTMCSVGEQPDAILMDFEMPVMNGPTATQHLRDEGYDKLIVGITGNVLPEDVAYFKSCGADEVLPKPLNVENFQDLFRNYSRNVASARRAADRAKLKATTKKTPSPKDGGNITLQTRSSAATAAGGVSFEGASKVYPTDDSLDIAADADAAAAAAAAGDENV
jgi:CheY-like chemotaxis protein